MHGETLQTKIVDSMMRVPLNSGPGKFALPKNAA